MSSSRDSSGPRCATSWIALVIGAVGSVGLVLHACARIGSPPLLLVLFGLWVLSPFVALAAIYVRSAVWSPAMQRALFSSILIVTLATLVIYAPAALGQAKPRAPVFVLVPPASLLFITIVLASAWFVSAKRSH